MEGGNNRKRPSGTVLEDDSSQEKRTKLLKSDSGASSKTQNGGPSNSQATLEYELFHLSSEEEGTSSEVKTQGEKREQPGGKDWGQNASPAHSASRETLVLSDVEEEEGADFNRNNTTSNTEPDPRQLWKETSLVNDADIIANIIPGSDATKVFETLAKHRGDPDRLNITTVTILESSATASSPGGHAGEESREATGAAEPNVGGETSRQIAEDDKPNNRVTEDVKKVMHKVQDNPQKESDDIFSQAVKLTSEFPHVDPSSIYELLEKHAGNEDCRRLVRITLLAEPASSADVSAADPTTPKPVNAREGSISNNPLVRDDPVFRDMRVVSKMFPEKDENEIYALVEAHYYKPDRVQLVIEELLRGETNSQEEISLSHSHAGELETSKSESGPGTPASSPLKAGINTSREDSFLQDDVRHLRDIFPDCDPNYIFERLEACKNAEDRVNVLATEMFEHKEYPRLKDVVEKQTKAARKHRLHKMKFTLQEFLAKFPDPATTFADEEKEMKESYKAHVTSQLKHDFPDFKSSYMKTVVDKHRSHLLPIVKEVEAYRHEILATGRDSKALRQETKDAPLVYPEEPDEYFFYELWYTLNEQRVKDHFDRIAARRAARVELARGRKELYECNCCFEDECLFEEMNNCADGHLFCRQCIARSVEAAFGEGKTSFPCLTGFCEHQIPLSVLKVVLPSSMFSKVLRKLQEEEVRQAGIPDLVDCPFCNFATIMDNPEDRVFHCLNPECLKDSCRFCQEPNHVPLKCEEVEKQSETDMRTFIEKRVTEAMLRKCHNCGKRFVKDTGCNKMTCICGATSCYICRQPDIDYSHFNGNKCGEGDMNKVHQQEMERAAAMAKAEFLKDHPEAADIDLKYNPENLIHNSQFGPP
ncbi:E3 ubiquitin-protein ligase RNF216-like isoform X2 [Littorina saxatilis]|uniref:E3 ubiquitin-protein ligase RNF216-like isoform X2 n=1 Tax=Littorina saxatilis TaxID=31220 RepID=UPI0038B5E913